jgi:hypothetical protein
MLFKDVLVVASGSMMPRQFANNRVSNNSRSVVDKPAQPQNFAVSYSILDQHLALELR